MRKLAQEEIAVLISQGCTAEDWNRITVADGFSTNHIHHTEFSGDIRLGVFDKEFTLPGGVRRHSGLNQVHLHNVCVGDNCRIEHVQN